MQQVVIDNIKEIIKSGKSNTSEDKLRALVLLNECVIAATKEGQGNPNFVNYIQKKIMERLQIMA